VEKARESLLPLARYLEADYYDPVLGLSFTSPEWPVSGATRLDGGSVQVGLSALYDPPRFPHRVDVPMVLARKSRTPSMSMEALLKEYKKEQAVTQDSRVLSTGEMNGLRVLRFVSGSFPNTMNDNRLSVWYSVLMASGKTELLIRALVPVQELERNQAIIERIVESVRMP